MATLVKPPPLTLVTLAPPGTARQGRCAAHAGAVQVSNPKGLPLRPPRPASLGFLRGEGIPFLGGGGKRVFQQPAKSFATWRL